MTRIPVYSDQSQPGRSGKMKFKFKPASLSAMAS